MDIAPHPPLVHDRTAVQDAVNWAAEKHASQRRDVDTFVDQLAFELWALCVLPPGLQ